MIFDFIKMGLDIYDAYDKLLGKKDKSIHIDKIQIKNIINYHFHGNELQAQYGELLAWLKSEGLNTLSKQVPSKFPPKEAIRFINNLPINLKESSISDLSTLLEYSAFEDKVVGENSIKEIIENLIFSLSEAKRDNLYPIITGRLIEADSDLSTVKTKKLEDKNIGGLVFVIQTNAQFSKEQLFLPEFIGFKKVRGSDNLVNLAIHESLEIEDLRLVKGSTKYDHIIEMRIRNLTDKPISFKICKGQVFENKNYESETQNLVSRELYNFEILPSDGIKDFSIDAFCLNSERYVPDGKQGNITFYRLLDDSFTSCRDVYKIVDLAQSKYE